MTYKHWNSGNDVAILRVQTIAEGCGLEVLNPT